jgi:hypothetical protein
MNTTKIRKGTFVRVNIPVLKYSSSIPGAECLPADTIYQVVKTSRVNPNQVRIYNNAMISTQLININNCTIVDSPKRCVKVGDVFNCSWGYEQTNQDFYMVTYVTNNSVRISRLDTIRKYQGPMNGTVTPVKVDPATLPQGELHRIKYNSNGTPCIRINSYSHAYPYNNEECFFSEWH